MYELPKEYSGKLICHFNCALEYSSEQFFQSEGVTVKNTPIGDYRETSDEPLVRFGYRFFINDITKPHMAVIAYPDDKRRFMCINDGTGYDLTTGVYTGDLYPVSNTVLEIYNIFWPRSRECSLTFSSVGKGEPAAALGFSIYELESLPAADGFDKIGGRSFGIQYEDPCGQGISEGAVGFDEWLERHIEYMRHSGQNKLVYPIVWYHGPQFPSKTQPSDTFDWVESPLDRKQYYRATLHPNDWVERLLTRFDEEKLEFSASMTIMRLGKLMQNMNIDSEAIKKGEPTYNNLRSDGQVQAGTGDWTAEYNMRNYPQMLEWIKAGKSPNDFPYVYGERRGDFGAGPMFNPLHPTVKAQISELITEVVDRYAKHPSLKGICINVWHATIIWFSSLEVGYDDYTVALFEKESNINLSVAANDPLRFSKRHDLLVNEYREKWIKWRCDKITEFICEIRDITLKNGLMLTLNFWNEPSRRLILGKNASQQYGEAEALTELLRQGGIDFAALSKENGIELSVETNLLRDRGNPAEGRYAPLEKTRIFHDLLFMDSSWTKELSKAKNPASFQFNCWIECWGKHVKFACEDDEIIPPEVRKIYGSEAEIIFRENCLYKDDGFWWESQSRIVPLFPVFPYYLEPNAFALAKYDTLDFTRGGICIDKANTAQILRFGRAFRALPKQRFELVEKRTDPVAVRKLKSDKTLYFYAVNTEPYPISVTIKLKNESEIFRLWSGEKIAKTNSFTFILDAFSLESFSAEEPADIETYELYIDGNTEKALLKKAEYLLKTLKNTKIEVSGKAELVEAIEKAIKNKEYTFLRHAEQSYIAKKIKI